MIITDDMCVVYLSNALARFNLYPPHTAWGFKYLPEQVTHAIVYGAMVEALRTELLIRTMITKDDERIEDVYDLKERFEKKFIGKTEDKKKFPFPIKDEGTSDHLYYKRLSERLSDLRKGTANESN